MNCNVQLVGTLCSAGDTPTLGGYAELHAAKCEAVEGSQVLARHPRAQCNIGAQVAAENVSAGISPPEPLSVLACLQSMHVSHSRACCSPGASHHCLAQWPAGVHESNSHDPTSEGAAGLQVLKTRSAFLLSACNCVFGVHCHTL